MSLFASPARLCTALAGLVVAQGLVLTGTAHAGQLSVHVERGQLVVQAAAGQANRLVITHVEDTLVVSDVVLLAAGTGCKRVADAQVACGQKGISSIKVLLADQMDSSRYAGSLPTTQDGGAGDDTLQGGMAGDTLMGGSGDDELSGGGGKDVLTGGLGSDKVIGGSGDDVLYGDAASSTPSCASLPQPGCMDQLYGGDGADELYGGEWGDVYWGGAGDDKLDDPASSGGSFLNGGPGNDIIDGATPNMRDSIDYSDRANGVQVDLAGSTGGEPGEHDTITNVQDIQGGAGDDKLSGNGWNNRIYGNGGFDIVDGGGGTDLCVAESVSTC